MYDVGGGGGTNGRVRTASMNDCMRRLRLRWAGASESGYRYSDDSGAVEVDDRRLSEGGAAVGPLEEADGPATVGPCKTSG